MTTAELVQRALAQRFAGGGAGPGVTPLTPDEWKALRELHAFLGRFACNSQVKAASAEDRARLEEFYSVVAGEAGPYKIVVDRYAHIADHAQAFIRATTKPQAGWIGQQLRGRGLV